MSSTPRFRVGDRVQSDGFGECVVVELVNLPERPLGVRIQEADGDIWLVEQDNLTPIAEPEPEPSTCPECGAELTLQDRGGMLWYGCPNWRNEPEPAPDPEPTLPDEVERVAHMVRDRIACEERNGHEWGHVGSDPIERCVHCGSWKPDPEPGSEFEGVLQTYEREVFHPLMAPIIQSLGGEDGRGQRYETVSGLQLKRALETVRRELQFRAAQEERSDGR